MEKLSRFSGKVSFTGKVVTSGARASASIYPTLVVTSTKDKFVLDKKAMALLGVSQGSYVALIDLNTAEVLTQDTNQRYFITKGYEAKNGNIVGAKVGKGGTFSYAGIYSAMQLNKPNIAEASVKDLVEAGLGILRDTEGGNESFVSCQKIHWKLERVVIKGEEGEPDITKHEVADGIFQEVFALVDAKFVEHNPKEIDSDINPEDND